ncbi:MAG: exodeoxyribonuclease VII small subunit [Atopobiaceae bacterium]
MGTPDVSQYSSFDQISGRLDQIVHEVKSKDTSIEHSLELFDEAIALGSKAVDLVDTAPASDAEKDAAAMGANSSQEAKADGAADGDGATATPEVQKGDSQPEQAPDQRNGASDGQGR